MFWEELVHHGVYGARRELSSPQRHRATEKMTKNSSVPLCLCGSIFSVLSVYSVVRMGFITTSANVHSADSGVRKRPIAARQRFYVDRNG